MSEHTDTALDSVDAVYYPAQVPQSLASLTMLACVFDRVYFPGVHLPDTFDEVKAHDVLRRLTARQPRDYEDFLRTKCYAFLVTAHKHVADWCIFTGTDEDVTGAIEPGTDEVAKALE